MVNCFLCGTKCFDDSTQVCSSILPYSNVPYPQKIAGLMGDEFVVIVTPFDHVCKNCSLLLTHMDNLENNLKLAKNSMLSFLENKYEILSHKKTILNQSAANAVTLVPQLKKQIFKCQVCAKLFNSRFDCLHHIQEDHYQLIPSTSNGEIKGVDPLAVTTFIKPKPSETQDNNQQMESNTVKVKKDKKNTAVFKREEADQETSVNSTADIYEDRLHMHSNENKKEHKKPILNQSAANALTPVPQLKNQIFKCQVCAKLFDSRIDCLHHIQDYHYQLIPSTSNGEIKGVDSLVVTTFIKPKPLETQDNNQQMKSMDIDKNQQDNTLGSTDVKQEKETNNKLI